MFSFSPQIDLDCLMRALSMSEINHLLLEQLLSKTSALNMTENDVIIMRKCSHNKVIPLVLLSQAKCAYPRTGHRIMLIHQ